MFILWLNILDKFLYSWCILKRGIYLNVTVKLSREKDIKTKKHRHLQVNDERMSNHKKNILLIMNMFNLL